MLVKRDSFVIQSCVSKLGYKTSWTRGCFRSITLYRFSNPVRILQNSCLTLKSCWSLNMRELTVFPVCNFFFFLMLVSSSYTCHINTTEFRLCGRMCSCPSRWACPDGKNTPFHEQQRCSLTLIILHPFHSKRCWWSSAHSIERYDCRNFSYRLSA